MTLKLFQVTRIDRRGEKFERPHSPSMQIVAASPEGAVSLWRKACDNTFATVLVEDITPERKATPDRFMNYEAREGRDRCTCGCKYWEDDRCVDCKTPITQLIGDPCWYADNREEDA